MFGIHWWQKITKALIASLIIGAMILSLVGCGVGEQPGASQTVFGKASPAMGNISEVSPPEVIQQLSQALAGYQPQVAILSPRPDEVLQDNKVQVKLQVRELPIFKNQDLDMGPHLHVILDNLPYIAVYDINQPLDLSDLEPGTHTIRVFASRPWHESFKNQGAYAQTTFHIFTKTQDNPNSTQPLLTYSRPKGSYGAEPILLDFYLTTGEDPKGNISNRRVRCTINGNSFIMDHWEAAYLRGFKPGKNWVQLELLDEQNNRVENVFNNTVRVITYEPQGRDTLSQLVRGEISADEARGIVEPNYTAKSPPSIIPTPTPTPTLPPQVIESPSPEEAAVHNVPVPQQEIPKDHQPAGNPSPELPAIPEHTNSPASVVNPKTTPQLEKPEIKPTEPTEDDALKPKLDVKEILLP